MSGSSVTARAMSTQRGAKSKSMTVWPGSEARPVKDGPLRAALNDLLSIGVSVHYAVGELLVGGIWKGFAFQTLKRLDERLVLLQASVKRLRMEVAVAMVMAVERDRRDEDRRVEAA
jgi:hypothetical protein